jgi:hypothetical protein
MKRPRGRASCQGAQQPGFMRTAGSRSTAAPCPWHPATYRAGQLENLSFSAADRRAAAAETRQPRPRGDAWRNCVDRPRGDAHICRIWIAAFIGIQWQSVPDDPEFGAWLALPCQGQRAEPEQAAPLRAFIRLPEQLCPSDASDARSAAAITTSLNGPIRARIGKASPVTGSSRSKSPAALNIPPEGSAKVTVWP